MSNLPLKLYGIKNCDTCKKALKWLDQHSKPYQWHDLKQTNILSDDLSLQLSQLYFMGQTKLINKASKTWKSLDNDSRETLTANHPQALAILLQHNPLLIKRPLFIEGHEIFFGFSEETKQKLIG